VGIQFDQSLSVGNISYRLDGAYQGKLFTNAENTLWAKIPGRLVSNARITWANDDGWKLGMEVQNLSDKYYFQSVSDVTTSLGLVTGVPALPRTYSAFVERRF
jgi:iron complex outermembrane receptor protein